MTAKERNTLIARAVGVVVGVGVVAYLSMVFTNKTAMAEHNSVNGPHGTIATDLAIIKRDVQWMRGQMQPPVSLEEDP